MRFKQGEPSLEMLPTPKNLFESYPLLIRQKQTLWQIVREAHEKKAVIS
jgi:hypothetical protein